MKNIVTTRFLLVVGFSLFAFAYHDILNFRPILYDDPSYLENRLHSISSGSYWWSLFTEPVANLWHPLTVFSHDCLSQIDYLAPWIHHLANGLLHLINAFLLFYWINKLSDDSLLAISSSLIWLLHPAVVESSTWISGRKDLLCLFFILVSLILARSERRCFFSMLTTALAVMAKPTAVMLPFILVFQDIALAKKSLWDIQFLKFSIKRHLPVLVLSFIVSFLTFYYQVNGGQSIADPRTFFERQTGATWALLQSVKLWVWPQNLHISYMDPAKLSIIYTASGLVLFGMATVIIASRKFSATVRVSLSFFLLFLLPTLGFLRAGNSLVADRYLYISGAGLTVLLLYVLTKFPRNLAGFTFIVIVFFSYLTKEQRQHWRSTEALFQRVISLEPKHPEMLAQLAIFEKQKGNHAKAKSMFLQSFEKNPVNPIAHLHMGLYAIDENELDKAYAHFTAMQSIRSNDIWLHENLAKIAWELGMQDEVNKHLKDALILAITEEQKARVIHSSIKLGRRKRLNEY